ncbi:MAG: hypothetical protein ACSHYF_01265 [Verrucomicrobiaceae bacterium]
MVLFLNSCIEGEEEIWINLDASGKIRAHYEFPPALRAQLGDPANIVSAIEQIDEAEDGIEVQQIQFSQVGSKLVFHLEATFDDARDLLEMTERSAPVLIEEAGMQPEELDAVAGDIDLNVDGLTVNLSRAISLGNFFPEMIRRNPSLLGKSNFRYLIHLPFPATKTNAHEVTNNGKSLSWIFVLRDHVDSPMALSFETQIRPPWWMLMLLGLIVILIAYLLWRRFLKA